MSLLFQEPSICIIFDFIKITNHQIIPIMKQFLYSLSITFLLIPTIVAAKTEISSTSIKSEIPTQGVINLSVANMRSKESFTSGMVTQGLLGMPVTLLQKGNRWYHIQLPDGYKGWVHPTAITPMLPEAYKKWKMSPKLVVVSLYATVHSKADQSSLPISDVVAGDELILVDSSTNFYEVQYPDGKIGFLSKENAIPKALWFKEIKQTGNSIARTALIMNGIPYLWAGTSTKGMDCSGFTQLCYRLNNILIPRDAYQQAEVGETRIKIAPDCSNLQMGDLIFFGRPATSTQREHIDHVGIFLWDQQYIQSQGYVHISSLNPEDPYFDEMNLNRLLFAGRILTKIGTKGISTLQTCSAYK